ncbi:uncharacterized protein Bfra_012043 [Botrytis fragariae]|uniref:Uncharacterized protein n=1 Tax=Botrytis fragariae TaxID=1964551 RepID=A0A8H6EDX1_9HELO|nr:uncharacterized protein Bfra_012043 [Botrytis fragariae]KAF5868712.1 hypothetical protein Bfra_012043 [Botrytis fragariae]
MSQADGPTLKAIFNTGFALSQVISKKLSSSEPVSQSHMSIFSSTPGLPTDLATPRPKKTKFPGPATQLLNELFEELDEIEAVESIEDSTYVNVDHARKRAGRLGHRPRPRIESSFKSKSLNGPHQSASSSDHFMNSSVEYSHLTVSPEEDLQKLADRFGEIQSRNKQIIEADDETIWNSLPDLNTGYFSRYAKVQGSAKAYEQGFQDTLKKEKEIYESTPGFINKQIPGLSATEMRKRIPRLIIAEAEYECDEEDEDEKSAIQILEALFKELAEREASTDESQWKSARQIIEEVENKGQDSKEGQAVAKGDREDKSEKCYGSNHDNHKSREINIFSDFAEQTDDEIRKYSAITQQYIKDGCRTKGLDEILEKDEGELVQSKKPNEVEPEVTPPPEVDEKDEKEITELQQDPCKVSPVTESPKVNKKDPIPQEQPNIEGNTKEDEDTQNSAQDNNTPENQNLHVAIAESVDEVASVSSSTISDSTSSIDGSVSEEEDEMQFGMAALATGVMVAALWMIERKTGVC